MKRNGWVLVPVLAALPVFTTGGCTGNGGGKDTTTEPGVETPDGDDTSPEPAEDPVADETAGDPAGDETAGDPAEEAEAPPECGNGVVETGEECDGDAPEDCTTSCGSAGTRTCTDECAWSSCAPPAETCNGIDDDCDGYTDEDFPCLQGEPTPCTTTCASTGTGTCSSTCELPPPDECTLPAETCNGIDDDCDGDIDEDFACIVGETESCTTTESLPGTRTCSSSCEWQECRIACPSECQVVPSGGEVGASCTSDASCSHGARCFTESVSVYEGELYDSWYDGACVPYGEGDTVCNPDFPDSCPAGSTCVYLGEAMGMEYYGCFDSCFPADTSGNPYGFNCGCREEYTCEITSGVCVPGCSHDRQCCERWWDLDGDYVRESGEVVLKEGCTNTCDDSPSGFCEATYACVNDGDPSNVWSGPCEGDPWCPPDGRCLDEFNYPDPYGDPYYPGGLCIKDACEYVGRGCGGHGGGCLNLGTTADPYWVCIGKCHFGRRMTDAYYECRTASGQEQACYPADESMWHTPPADGSNGFCWPGNFPGGSAETGAYCMDDTDCLSPYGLGYCVRLSGITATKFCSAYCDRYSAEGFAVCGGDDGTGTASGACWLGLCWEGCDSPGADLGVNGCTQSAEMACYSTSTFTDAYKDGASAMPAGLCIPRCTDSAWCADFWGMSMSCDTATGICE